MAGKGAPRTGGRQKGSLNKVTRMLKDDILAAAEQAPPMAALAVSLSRHRRTPPPF